MFGKRFDFAGDELTGDECAAILTRITEHQVVYEALPLSIVKQQSDDMAAMFEWFDRVGYNVDIPALHRFRCRDVAAMLVPLASVFEMGLPAAP